MKVNFSKWMQLKEVNNGEFYQTIEEKNKLKVTHQNIEKMIGRYLPPPKNRNPIAICVAIYVPYEISAWTRFRKLLAILSTCKLPLPAITLKEFERIYYL